MVIKIAIKNENKDPLMFSQPQEKTKIKGIQTQI